MKRSLLYTIIGILAIAVIALAVMQFTGGGDNQSTAPAADVEGLGDAAAALVAERGLTSENVYAALKTYMPSGQHDPYVMFASGGHSGQLHVIGVPSMRILRTIAVFAPEPWQGYGYGEKSQEAMFEEGDVLGAGVRWGDTHHPALSETGGRYDGDFIFINDKAQARVGVVDLRDFETKQLVKNPIAMNDHGGTFVTPDTEWVIEGGQYAAPPGGAYAPISDYNDEYRGMITFWKFDREQGRILMDESFAMELPPYWQDLCDSGKLVSEGWIFCNSFNTERATGGAGSGEDAVPFESGASQNDMDYLHVIDLNKVIDVAANNENKVNDFNYISLETAVDENLFYFIPEPKSPHGIDVAPKGDFMVVSGKLDPHVTIYSFDKIMTAIKDQDWTPDEYGIPVLNFDSVMEAQVELGLGPLHTQFDNKGYAYTSLYLDSAVARWTLGGDYDHADEAWTLIDKESIHYNVGHIAAVEGDTVEPAGNFLVALNKWSVDRFNNVGPLLPQNLQLIDISGEGESLQLLYDMPMGIGEPHYAQIIKAERLHPVQVYPEVGWNPHEWAVDENATLAGQERIERDGKNVEVWMTSIRSHFTPEHVEINQGDHVTWHITNIEQAVDAVHGFAMPAYNINLSIEPGETATVEFDANKDGVFSFYCTEFCSALHLEMTGYLLIKPNVDTGK
ncbi:MAG: Sec-dependent nitrous-oxide reductase [Caldilineaceae bacterium]|nr:Sec-dependent nitrous-oxide reductase [Caldilineaceae bacterium]